jgi:uncharacterized protein
MKAQSFLPLKTSSEIDFILRTFRDGLEELYGERLRGVYVYGSYARGDARPGSDLDVLLILDRIDSYSEEIDRTGEITSDLSLEYDIAISRAFVTQEDWVAGEMPLVRNVRREGRAA